VPDCLPAEMLQRLHGKLERFDVFAEFMAGNVQQLNTNNKLFDHSALNAC